MVSEVENKWWYRKLNLFTFDVKVRQISLIIFLILNITSVENPLIYIWS
jgi:hypothetical protein